MATGDFQDLSLRYDNRDIYVPEEIPGTWKYIFFNKQPLKHDMGLEGE